LWEHTTECVPLALSKTRSKLRSVKRLNVKLAPLWDLGLRVTVSGRIMYKSPQYIGDKRKCKWKKVEVNEKRGEGDGTTRT